MKLTEQMAHAWESCGHEWVEPEDADVHSLSKSWRELVSPLYDDQVGVEGWKTDWMRAAKLYWLQHIGTGILWENDFVLEKSTHVPGPVYSVIAMWIRGDPVDSLGDLRSEQAVNHDRELREATLTRWLIRQRRSIWDRADELRIGHERQYHRRAIRGTMTVEDLQQCHQQQRS